MRATKAELEARVLKEMFVEWMDDIVGECDVCKNGLSRAEIHLMEEDPNGFGCFTGCKRRMGRS